jgi:hypothetical protein
MTLKCKAHDQSIMLLDLIVNQLIASTDFLPYKENRKEAKSLSNLDRKLNYHVIQRLHKYKEVMKQNIE